MQEMKLIDAVALKEKWLYSDHKGMFVDFIDNAPEVPAVPLDVYERMKRELNEEIAKLKANNDRLTYCQVCEKCELETATNQHFCNKYGGYVSETDCCSRGNIKRNGG